MTRSNRLPPSIAPLKRTRLPDDLADRIKLLIQRDGYAQGDRLPSIAALTRDFEVGAPTVREALKRLEMAGMVSIRHGSGVYVGREDDSFLMTNPVYSEALSKKILLDLIEARTAIEVIAAGLAASRVTETQLHDMARLLDQAEANLGDDDALNQVNMAFHRTIAVASGNAVFRQLLEVMTSLFTREQRAILDIQNARGLDHRQHVGIYVALRNRDAKLARDLMREHLEKVRDDLERWDEAAHPIR